MRIYGDISLDPQGAQILNQRLENAATQPSITSTGRIYYDTTLKKVMVWNGTTWVQVSSSPNYQAGDGLLLDVNNKFNINLYNNTANTSGLMFDGGYLKLKVDPTLFQLDGDGLSILPASIGPTFIVGPLPDSVLAQITTASKVAASAVEPLFIRNDLNQTTAFTLTMKDIVLTPQTPAPSSTKGKMYYESSNDKIYYYDGVSWQQIYTSSANVHSVTGTSPIVVTPTTGDVVVSMPAANGSTNGYLTSLAYTAFANKQDAITFGNGLNYSAPNLTVKLAATNPALQFVSGGLAVKLKSGGGILADSNGLYLDTILGGFQAVWNLDGRRPNVWFNIDAGGSFNIHNFANDVTIFQVRDGTIGTSGVTTTSLTVDGDLDVIGDNTRISTTQLYIKDRSVQLGYLNPATGIPAQDTSIEVLRGSLSTVSIRYNESHHEWEFTNDGISFYPIGVGSIGKQSQAFINQTSLTFTHNLNDRYPNVQVFDSSNNIIKELEVTTIDLNNVLITFESPQTGTAIATGGPNALGLGGIETKYSTIFNVSSAPWQVTIPATTHNIGFTDEIFVQVMDNSSPRNIIYPTAVTISSAGTVVVTFSGAQQGKIILQG